MQCHGCVISIHSLRMEGDVDLSCHPPSFKLFQSTPSAWRETCSIACGGGDATFQSTPSAWRETPSQLTMTAGVTAFQSTPSAWRETQNPGCSSRRRSISIHSLRMEGDTMTGDIDMQTNISIHSLRMEGDWHRSRGAGQNKHFNPLPPHGGRPHSIGSDVPANAISIHSLRMEGDRGSCLGCRIVGISIHSLRMEGDDSLPPSDSSPEPFQSTPSAWRETIRKEVFATMAIISIHSLRMEGDPSFDWMSRRRPDISIHSLRMEGDRFSAYCD